MDDSASVIPDPAMTALHLDLLFRGTEGYVPIRILQEKDGVPFRKVLPFILNDVELVTRVTPFVLNAAAAGAASFVVPATVQKPGSAKKADIAQMTCLLVDLDTGDIPAARSHLEAHLGRASMVMTSGGITETGQNRLHLYWRLAAVVSGSDLTRLCELRGILAAKVGGDTSFASPHQPIRLAGSIYAKSGLRRLVQIVDTSDQIYTLSQIDKAVCEMPTLEGIATTTFSIATGVKGPSASDLKLRKIRADGQDDVTRFAAIGKVIGHWLHVVRSGRITVAHAWEQVQNHNAACIDPPWPDARLRESFDALFKRDVKTHGPMPDLDQFFDAELGADGSTRAANIESRPQTLPEAVFLSEDDLADRFVTRFRAELRFVPARGAWMPWTGQLWKQDETSLATDRIRMICRVAADMLSDEKMARKLCSERTIAAVGKLARTDPRIAEPGSAWDRGEMIINTPAGTLDLATGEMRPHASGDLLTRITSASVGQNCPRWLRFIDEVTGGKPGLADYLQRVAGYCLTGSMSEQVFFFLHGTGANGKSVFIAALSHVLGDYAATAPLDTFTSSNGDRHPTDLAGLATARAVFVTETEQGRPWAESKIKAITGGDKLRVRFLYRDFFEIEPTFKILVAGNVRPRLIGVGEAMKRRLHLIPFDVTIPPKKREKDLLEQLHRERDGIFYWMLEGCKAWQERGLQPPPCIEEAAEEYFRDEDLVMHWIEERCEMEDHAKAPSSLLFKSWSEWADARGFDRGSQRSLGEELRSRGFKAYRTGRERGWLGLRPRHAPVASAMDRSV